MHTQIGKCNQSWIQIQPVFFQFSGEALSENILNYLRIFTLALCAQGKLLYTSTHVHNVNYSTPALVCTLIVASY
jgi:hypothetical protein